jgi:hypothetical protein
MTAPALSATSSGETRAQRLAATNDCPPKHAVESRNTLRVAQGMFRAPEGMLVLRADVEHGDRSLLHAPLQVEARYGLQVVKGVEIAAPDALDLAAVVHDAGAGEHHESDRRGLLGRQARSLRSPSNPTGRAKARSLPSSATTACWMSWPLDDRGCTRQVLGVPVATPFAIACSIYATSVSPWKVNAVLVPVVVEGPAYSTE